ncbi:septation protein A, partial [Magnetococcales bacterium HHB-1]
MEFLRELFPLILFFIFYQWFDIYVATAVLMVTIVLMMAYLWWKHHHLTWSQRILLGGVLLFGGATLFLRDPRFIQWKPTIVQWLFSVAFLMSHYLGDKKVLLQRLMGEHIQLSSLQWLRLSWAWIVFFFFSGILNIIVAYQFSEEIWVKFKVFGLMGLTLIFVIGQSLFLARWLSDNPSKEVSEK